MKCFFSNKKNVGTVFSLGFLLFNDINQNVLTVKNHLAGYLFSF